MATEFVEIQRFTQRWLWVLLIFTMLILVSVFAHGFVEQLVFGRPWGDRPVSDGMLVLTGSAVILFSMGMVYLFYSLRLITEARKDGLYIRFYPLWGKLIPYSSIQHCAARTYKPLSEYGGWGIKYGRSGWAYNIVGNKGVQLVLEGGKRIMVGSQCAEELEHAIRSHCNI